MGQLFDRVFNFIKSEVNGGRESGKSYVTDDSDEELRRIIDELNREYKAKTANNSKKTEAPRSESLKPEVAGAFRVMGLTGDASNDEIKSAYRKKMLEFHPDRTVNLSADEKRNAENRTKEINRAYAILRTYRRF